MCHEHVGITTGQILEHWREKENRQHLEMLAVWDHLISEENIEVTFKDNLAYLYQQLIEQRIELLIAKDRQQTLTLAEKKELAELLSFK